MPSTKSEKEWMSKVASIGCIICRMPATIHHIRAGMGMGQRNSHYNVLPLCHNHHQGKEGIHTLGTKTWQRKYGDEKELLKKVKSLVERNEMHDWFV